MSVWTDENATGELDEEFGAHIRWQVESVAAGMHPADAAVMLADMAEWATDRAREETQRTAVLFGFLSSYENPSA